MYSQYNIVFSAILVFKFSKSNIIWLMAICYAKAELDNLFAHVCLYHEKLTTIWRKSLLNICVHATYSTSKLWPRPEWHHSDLALWPVTSKIYTVHPWVTVNTCAKFEENPLKRSWDFVCTIHASLHLNFISTWGFLSVQKDKNQKKRKPRAFPLDTTQVIPCCEFIILGFNSLLVFLNSLVSLIRFFWSSYAFEVT